MLTKTLLKISQLLKENDIPYMVIGGYAVLYHGEPRFTEDIDIVVGVDSGSLTRVLHFLSNEFVPRPENVTQFVNQTNVLPLISKEDKIKVDLIFSFIEFERKAIQNAIITKIKGKEVKIVRAEDLIIYKLLAGRPKDLEDAINIIDHNSESINRLEIDQVIRELAELMQNQKIIQDWNSISERNN